MSGLLAFKSLYSASVARVPKGSPFLHEADGNVSMHFDFTTVQSRMRKGSPHELVLDYTQAMMGFLLFQPQPKQIAMIGLGGGSLAKYCHRFLPEAFFTAVEIHPEVIALRDEFSIPPDGPGFQVINADGADYVRSRTNNIDVLLVDGFDVAGQPRQLCSAGFYDDCYAKLGEDGVMVVNLWKGDSKFGLYASRIRDSFEDKVVVVDMNEHGNRVAFACKGRNFPPSHEMLKERVKEIGVVHPVALHLIARKVLERLRSRASFSGIW